jgi:hypothetical protein
MKEGEERKVRLRTKDFIVRLTSARPSDEPQTFNVIFTRVLTPVPLLSVIHSKKTQRVKESFVSYFIVLF